MSSRPFCQRIVAGLALLTCLAATAPAQAANQGSDNERAVLRYLAPALSAAGKVGRIYARTVCRTKNDHLLPFPATGVQPPSGIGVGLVATRDIFRSDPSVVIAEKPLGIIRVVVGAGLPSPILQTKISSLKLKPLEQYNPELAIDAIESSRDVSQALRKADVSFPPELYNFLLVQPAPGLAHLPGELKTLTVDQALDMIARTFHGIIVFEDCMHANGKGLIVIDYAASVDPNNW